MRARAFAIALLIAAAFAAGALAQAATNWKVFATGTDSDQYFAYASASGDVTKPKGLAIRARASGTADLSYFVSCQGENKSAQPNKIYVLTFTAFKKCSVNGSATKDGG